MIAARAGFFIEGRMRSAGKVRARLPAKPMNSVSEREPRGERKEECGRSAGQVRARLPAKPMNSVSEREPRGEKSRKAGPVAGFLYGTIMKINER